MKKKIFLLFMVSLLLLGCGNDTTEKKNDDKSVDDYVEKSNKKAFIDTSVSYVDAVRAKVNAAENFHFFTQNVLYMVPVGHEDGYTCATLEIGGESPFSDTWNYAYVGVIYNGTGYDYYFVSEDKAGYGVEIHSSKALYDQPIDDIYNTSKSNESGYSILNQQYQQHETKVYEREGKSVFNATSQNTQEFSELEKILNIDNYEYNAIVFVGAPDCTFTTNVN